MELFGQNLQALGKQNNLFCVYGNFACFCFEYKALDADDITDVIFFECSVILLADVILADIGLHQTVSVLNIAEGCLPHDTLAHQSACDANILILQRIKVRSDFVAVVCHVIFYNLEGVLACFLHLCQLFSSDSILFTQLLLGQLLIFFCHFSSSCPFFCNGFIL